MGNYAGDNTWPSNIYQFEQTDVVQGGPTGIDNVPLKQLADRTAYLLAALRGYFGVTSVSSAKALTTDEINNKVVLLSGNTAFAISLPTLTAAHVGLRVTLVSQSSKQITLNANVKVDDTVARNVLYIGSGEKLELFFDGTNYHLLDHSSNLFSVGEFGYAYKLQKNAVVADGSLLLRADYPRLFEFVQSLQAQNSVVSETNWNTIAGNKGFFTLGTNSSNFRVPDLRSMFIRGLDLGAGITYGRNNANPGGYEADEFKSHTHGVNASSNGTLNGSKQKLGWSDNENSQAGIMTTNSTGGTETRPKNIGLIPYLLV